MTVRLDLSDDERDLLRSLPQQLLTLLDSESGDGDDDPALRRLFPPAYATQTDVELEAEYRRLMGADLRDRHRTALEVLMATAGAKELDDEQAQSWLVALNELRLVLGTRLDVQEDDDPPTDPDDPRAPGYALYQYLTWLQDSLIDQLPLP
ncbi:MAG: hypothetical protein QOI20_1170 [Acidimicrobiaceae bacterium]|jgi:hypothetical protein|nr:hypothetical protein [Acidimicrobiaceae bacterium]